MDKPADLFEAEERLWRSVVAGKELDLGDRVPSGRAGGRRKQIRAETVVALLRGDVVSSAGAVFWVEGALITGVLDLRHVRLDLPVTMKNCRFTGRIDLTEARVASISLSGSHFPSVVGYGLRVDGDADFSGCQAGQIDIFAARISGRVWLAGAELGGTGSGRALNAPDLTVAGGMYCRGLRAVGGVNLFGAVVGSGLELDGAVLSNQAGLALRAPGLSVKADMSCGNGFTATGGMDMFGAQIGGQLWLNDARLDKGDREYALNAPQISVSGGLYCNGQFVATGMINLFGAAVGATMEFDGATLTNPAGICLRAPGLTVKSSLSFTGGFTARGDINLAGSQVSGEMQFSETILSDSTVDLRGAHIGELHAVPTCLPGRLFLNGLTYTGLQPYLPAAQRLETLCRDEDGYHPQPYEQLAVYYRALGYDEQARAVLPAKQRRRREGLPLAGKAWGYLQDAAVGYGYRPTRALIWLVVLIALTAGYFSAYPPHSSADPAYAQFQPVIYAFYAVVPVLNIGQPNPYPASAAGQWMVLIAQVAGWTLATTVIAGITRAISRN
jgi:hypothetical protein